MLHRFPFLHRFSRDLRRRRFRLFVACFAPSESRDRPLCGLTSLNSGLPEFSPVCPSSVIVFRAASSSDPNNLYRNQSMTTYPGLRLAMTAAGELPVGERWRAIGACLRLSGQIRHVDETSEVRNGRVEARTLPRGCQTLAVGHDVEVRVVGFALSFLLIRFVFQTNRIDRELLVFPCCLLPETADQYCELCAKDLVHLALFRPSWIFFSAAILLRRICTSSYVPSTSFDPVSFRDFASSSLISLRLGVCQSSS
jgi:hypothetical protein